MEYQYIENSRFTYPTIWINNFDPLAQYTYPGETGGKGSYLALDIGQALDLYKALTLGLREAGQGGMLTAEIKGGKRNER